MAGIMFLAFVVLSASVSAAKAAHNHSEVAHGSLHEKIFAHMHMHEVKERMDHVEDKLDSAICKLDKLQTALHDKLDGHEALLDAKLEVLELKFEKNLISESSQIKDQLRLQIDRVLDAIKPEQPAKSSQFMAEGWKTIFFVSTGGNIDVLTEWNNVYKWSVQRFMSSISKLRVSMRSWDLVQYVTFNVTRMHGTDWFRASNIIDSSYEDLTPETTFNYFTPVLQATNRTFYISKNHGGCAIDAGWMVVVGGTICGWERRAEENHPIPRFLFCPRATSCVWENEGILADAFTIEAFLK